LTKQRQQAPQMGGREQSYLTQRHPECYDQVYREKASCKEEGAFELARGRRPR